MEVTIPEASPSSTRGALPFLMLLLLLLLPLLLRVARSGAAAAFVFALYESATAAKGKP